MAEVNVDLCEWCGRNPTYPDKDVCYCGFCVECKFTHDVGPPRSGWPRGQARSIEDGFVHAVAWSNTDHCFPVCWPHANHEVPLPTRDDFAPTDDSTNCIACLGR